MGPILFLKLSMCTIVLLVNVLLVLGMFRLCRTATGMWRKLENPGLRTQTLPTSIITATPQAQAMNKGSKL